MLGIIENRCKCSPTQALLWHKSEFIDFVFLFRLCFIARPQAPQMLATKLSREWGGGRLTVYATKEISDPQSTSIRCQTNFESYSEAQMRINWEQKTLVSERLQVRIYLQTHTTRTQVIPAPMAQASTSLTQDHISSLLLLLWALLTHSCGTRHHASSPYLPYSQDVCNCKVSRLLSVHRNTECAIIAFWKWGPREVFSMKSNLHFSATNVSFLLRRIICTTDLYLKIEGWIYAKMISGDHHRNKRKSNFLPKLYRVWLTRDIFSNMTSKHIKYTNETELIQTKSSLVILN